MKVYKLQSDVNKYQNLVVEHSSDWDILAEFSGYTLNYDAWQPLKVRIIRDNEFYVNQLPSDFPSLSSSVPVFSEHAANILQDILRKNGQLFPINCEGQIYFVYNVTCLVDVLDYEHSKFERFQSSGRIMDVSEHHFLKDSLSHLIIFKIPETQRMDVYITDTFVDLVQSLNLQGFIFEEIGT